MGLTKSKFLFASVVVLASKLYDHILLSPFSVHILLKPPLPRYLGSLFLACTLDPMKNIDFFILDDVTVTSSR